MTSLRGVRVLVIEDEAPIALMIEDMLQDMGCIVAGSAASVAQALGCIETGGFDFALAKSGVPFAFASGYGRAGVPAHLQDRPALSKPFTSAALEKILRDALRANSQTRR